MNGALPFSDEGDVALALTKNASGRTICMLLAIALSLTLTVLAAHQYGFTKRPVLKSCAVYVLSLTVGIAVFWVLLGGHTAPLSAPSSGQVALKKGILLVILDDL